MIILKSKILELSKLTPFQTDYFTDPLCPPGEPSPVDAAGEPIPAIFLKAIPFFIN